MTKLKNKIINAINLKKKNITIEKFIQIAMYDKKHGYYRNKSPIGKDNDFITSPEITQLFGEMIGLYIIDYWKKYLKKEFNLVELGPGKGTLIKDLINISNKFPDYLKNLNINMFEINKELIKIQKKNLAENIKKINSLNWISDLNNLTNKNTVFVANEFFDCLPVRQGFILNNKYFENIIKFDQRKKIFFFDKIKLKKESIIAKKIKKIYLLSNLKEGNIVEIESKSEKYIKQIAKIMIKTKSLFILIDYGNYISSGVSTIQSIKNHKKTNIFDNIGNQDLSHMLDFSYYENIFKLMGLRVYGPYSQRNFLNTLGIDILKKKITKNLTPKEKRYIESGVNRIISKDGMGQLFKVLIISSHKLNNYE